MPHKSHFSHIDAMSNILYEEVQRKRSSCRNIAMSQADL